MVKKSTGNSLFNSINLPLTVSVLMLLFVFPLSLTIVGFRSFWPARKELEIYEEAPYPRATFSLEAAAAVQLDEIVPVQIFVNSPEGEINTVHLEINYSSDNLSLEEVSFSDSVMPNVVEKDIGSPGVIKLTSYNFNPYKGNHGLVTSLNFKALKAGETRIEILASSKIHLGDGLGTDIFDYQNSQNSLFLTIEPLPLPSLSPTPTVLPSPTPQVQPGEECGFCGGFGGIVCKGGLYCDYGDGRTFAPYPDASGICKKELVADLNNDGWANNEDRMMMLNKYDPLIEVVPSSQGDLNGDGFVNSLDYGLLVKDWGQNNLCPKKEV